MEAILNFIHRYAREFYIVFIALAVLRMGVCAIELRQTAKLRVKKGKYHSVKRQYGEIGAWIFSLPGLALGAVFSPQLWYLWLVLAAAGIALGYKLGKKKGADMDDMFRDIAIELRQEEAAEAAREAASHTLESGAEPLPEHEDDTTGDTADDTIETTDEGESDNG